MTAQLQRRVTVLAMRNKALRTRLAIVENEDSPHDMRRASGRARCESCGMEYYDHPEHPGIAWLTILCDGSLVKL